MLNALGRISGRHNTSAAFADAHRSFGRLWPVLDCRRRLKKERGTGEKTRNFPSQVMANGSLDLTWRLEGDSLPLESRAMLGLPLGREAELEKCK